jgi:hypothetical protein
MHWIRFGLMSFEINKVIECLLGGH